MSLKGVTLLEAFVILAVTAILTVILFPVLAPRCGRASHMDTCKNKQRQLSVAILMYVQDREKTFFPDPGSFAWAQYLTMYAVGDESFDCPTLTGKGKAANPEYGFNANLFSRKLADIPQPASTLLTTDLKPSGMFTNYALTSANPSDAHYFEEDIDPRHNSGIVYSCADGHMAYAPVKHGDTIHQTLKAQGIYFNPASVPTP